MSGRRIIILLSHSHLNAIVLNGNRVRLSHDVEFKVGNQPGDWRNAVSRAGRLIRPFVEENRLSGTPTTVLYRSPSELADLVTIPLGSADKACSAAELSCVDSINYPADLAVTSAMPIGTDRVEGGSRTHVLALAERDDVLAAMASMVEDSGLKYAGAAPRSSITLAGVTKEAMRDRRPLAVRLHIEQFGAVFIATSKRSLLFARQISFGTDMLTQALTRPIRPDRDEKPVTLSLAAARDILCKHGLPEASADVSTNPHLKGLHILPLIEPHLQRLVVEMKQSLRFGLTDEQRAEASIELTGPGAAIQRLATVLTTGLDVTVSSQESETPASEAFDQSKEAQAAGRTLTRLRRALLWPNDAVARIRMARLKSWLWTGAAAAGLMLALEAIQWEFQLRDLRTSASTVEQQATEVEQLQTTSTRIAGIVNSLGNLAGEISAALPPDVNYEALLKEFSRLTPPHVRLTRMDIDQSVDGCRIAMHGFATAKVDGLHTGPGAYVAKLQESPLIAHASLGGVRHGVTDGTEVQYFELTVTPVTLPRDHLLASADVSDREVNR